MPEDCYYGWFGSKKMKAKKLGLVGLIITTIASFFGGARAEGIDYNKGIMKIKNEVNDISNFFAGWDYRINHNETGTEGFGDNDIEYSITDWYEPATPKIVSNVEGHLLRTDARLTNSLGLVNLELSLHSEFGEPIEVSNLENQLRCYIDPLKYKGFDFLPKPITLWERNIIDPNENPNDPNNYTISFLADIRDANDKQGGTGTATIPLADLNGTYGSQVPYMYTQLRFNTFSGDFNLDGKVDLKDYAYWANCDPIADITGANGLPDRNVDFYDLSLFTRDYLKDSNDPNTW